MDISNVENSYNKVAEIYTKSFYTELDHKPMDRYLLDEFSGYIKETGRVCDLGCGPGHISNYLKSRDISVFGLDLSEGMLTNARKLNPQIDFVKGNMLSLKLEKESLAGIVSYYSIVNFSINEVKKIIHDIWSILEEGGALFLAFHVGDEELKLNSWFDQDVQLDFTFFNLNDIVDILLKEEFCIIEALSRYPYKDYEHMSQKGYIIAKKCD